MNDWPAEYQAYGVTLKPLSQAMLETVRHWRNDPVIASLMLDKTHITSEMQQAWFDKLQGDQSRAYWVVYFKDEPIGVASLVNICLATKVCEPGMYVYPERYRNNIVPFCIAFALNDFAFNVLGMRYLMGKIYPDNKASLRFHDKCGYQVYGKGEADLVLVKLEKNAYQIARDPLAKFIRY
ncbi:UDP-4-amino-4,6-dideoxy-N-acetyl-beta-L-altrosamine N-acetyltransferase [Shewanella baltica]|uniref:UDP-4-amino-4, 6-dideoxy-N-acetyl-beta-L-altrosamine N-acetyltransferase n=1 Tax=Shewanella baltica TaxID=62322 RepID=UPI003D081C0C